MSPSEFLKWERASRDTIDFKKIYVDIAGSLSAGLMLSQIVFWHLPGDEGKSKLRVQQDGYWWIVKKNEDWWDECRVPERTAKRKLSDLKSIGIIETKVFKFGGAPTVHIRIIWEKFMELWTNVLSAAPLGQSGPIDQSGESDRAELANSNGPTRPDPQTKTTIQRPQSFSSSLPSEEEENDIVARPISSERATIPPSASPLPDEVGFDLKDVEPNVENDLLYQAAKRLLRTLQNTRMLETAHGYKPKLRKWMEHLRSLKKFKFSEDEIEAAVRVYTKHFDDNPVTAHKQHGLPRVGSAAKFVELFDWIWGSLEEEIREKLNHEGRTKSNRRILRKGDERYEYAGEKMRQMLDDPNI